MPSDDTVSEWILDLKAGDSLAVQKLWERYYKRLVGLARRILRNTPCRAADESDVALSAFNSFWHRAAEGKFPRLEDRDDLWKLLMTITVRKALQLSRKEQRRQATNELDFLKDQIANQEPSPAMVAMINDEFERLFGLLDDERLRRIALLKLEGYRNKEIADRLGRSVSLVERKLQLIRRLWCQKEE
jgi:RNA polymerase sigma factor (sigma-70 family)